VNSLSVYSLRDLSGGLARRPESLLGLRFLSSLAGTYRDSLLGGHDTCVVMPTGGGKSLCYQLPALVLGKTAVVVSPLIALMQDQAASLAQMGIPAAVLNSTMASTEPVPSDK